MTISEPSAIDELFTKQKKRCFETSLVAIIRGMAANAFRSRERGSAKIHQLSR